MPDNFTLPGTGQIIATDEIDGVEYIRVKIATGADGEASDITFQQRVPVEDDEAIQTLRLILAEIQKLNFTLSIVLDTPIE